jgi:zinc protease
LFQVLRIEKGYTYGAYSFVGKAHAVSPFAVNSSVRSNATLPSLQIIQTMLSEYGKNFSESDVEITRKKVLKNNTLAFESLGSKLNILREISKYGKPVNYIEQDQRLLLSMNVDDFKKTIESNIKEEDMIYLIVGDKATQLKEVEKLKGKVTELDIYGEAVIGDR